MTSKMQKLVGEFGNVFLHAGYDGVEEWTSQMIEAYNKLSAAIEDLEKRQHRNLCSTSRGSTLGDVCGHSIGLPTSPGKGSSSGIRG